MIGARVVLDRVSRAYGRAEVLHEVSLRVEPGELVALTGPSGSGKTTVLQLIGALDRPTSGQIQVDDVSVGELRRPALFRRRTVGFVFQLHYLLPALSARENVELPMMAAHVPRSARVARALELLAEVDLADVAARSPADLSGGERQRVAIARALANHPALVLADEPTGSLDTAASRRVGELLGRVRDRRGTTVIVASHDPTIRELADRAIALVDGRIVPEYEPREFLS
jgi:ABC-type lipoprotein export system ATPase subunit